ncbi:oxaloacetate tautomerase fahd2, mitochondrial-like [Saccoglossus kowalevskii]|uniref:Fumarylacetoacetate hydrolase domain-containing protein 2-like n=1 Tax=Saccoglossus kowalevskii TaxID=10224 RepID=A0ABM0GZW6_SACKO|nr:PREDICTED: fumarylacetoacetate hydrolase domain-containing protein 2-like [Saccoglossus kowalevskii]
MLRRAVKSYFQYSFTNSRAFSTNARCSMRLVQFIENNVTGLEHAKVGVELSDGAGIVDLASYDSSIPKDMVTFLGGGAAMLDIAKRAVASGQHVVRRDNIKLKAPITNPDKVLCIGNNYADHCAEQGIPVPTEPVIFSKFSSTIIGPGEDILYPETSDEIDWEVELVVVIGRAGKNIQVSDAMNHVVGFTVGHDVSARDWQLKKNGGQYLIGKSMDTFCPIGPAIVTKDEITDPHKLGIRCKVNGDTMQDSNTNQLVFKTEALVSFISRFLTLQPGDIILTGTPPGVGVFHKPNPIFLKRGDVVDCEIDGLGTLSNKVI